MSQIPHSRKYATRNHLIEPLSLTEKLNSVAIRAVSKSKTSQKKSDVP